MKCRFCGCRIDDDVDFCPFCGAEQRPRDVFIINGVTHEVKSVKILGEHIWLLVERPNDLPQYFTGDMVVVHDNKDYQLTDCEWHGDKDPDGNWYYGPDINDMWYDGLLRGRFHWIITEDGPNILQIVYDD